MPEITKISHGITIGDLKYGNAKPGVVEATLKPGETMEQALDELDERLNAWHRKRYPHLYQDDYGVSNPLAGPISYTKESITPPIIDKSIERLEIAIDNCQTLEELDQLKKDNPVMTHKLLVQWDTRREILRIEANNKATGQKNS